MERKIARVNWSRGKYSDVFRSCIVDQSPLKQGQQIKVLWGKTKREYSAVIECYPFEESQQPLHAQETLASRRAKAKRKLVSIYLTAKPHLCLEFTLFWAAFVTFNLTRSSSPTDPRVTSHEKGCESQQ